MLIKRIKAELFILISLLAILAIAATVGTLLNEYKLRNFSRQLFDVNIPNEAKITFESSTRHKNGELLVYEAKIVINSNLALDDIDQISRSKKYHSIGKSTESLKLQITQCNDKDILSMFTYPYGNYVKVFEDTSEYRNYYALDLTDQEDIPMFDLNMK